MVKLPVVELYVTLLTPATLVVVADVKLVIPNNEIKKYFEDRRRDVVRASCSPTN